MESNKLKFKIGQVRNVVIVIPVNVPAWAKDKDRRMVVSNGHYCLLSNIVPNLQMLSTELIIPVNFDNNENFACCFEFRGEKEAKQWIVNISNLIREANSEHPNVVINEETNDDILWTTVS